MPNWSNRLKLVAALKEKRNQLVSDRAYFLKSYPQCFVGNEVVSWLVKNAQHKRLVTTKITRALAVGMLRDLFNEAVIQHVEKDHEFKDKFLYYKFVDHAQEMCSEKAAREQSLAEDAAVEAGDPDRHDCLDRSEGEDVYVCMRSCVLTEGAEPTSKEAGKLQVSGLPCNIRREGG